MEMFGILFSIPAAFLASTVWCGILAHTIKRFERLSRCLYTVSLIVLVAFISEVVLLITLGAVQSRGMIGPVFYVVHSAIFFLGTPALANVALLHRRSNVLTYWYLVAIPCTIFALVLVLMQYGVSEALYGINGTNGPYS
jgi:hypothetical protein